MLDVFVSIIPTLVEPTTSLSATSEFALFVGSALGTRGALAASTRLGGCLAFFASARSAGAWPCRFDDKTSYQAVYTPFSQQSPR